MRRGIGHMLAKSAKPRSAAGGIQAAVEFGGQRVVKLERAELAGRGGNVVDSAACFIAHIQAALDGRWRAGWRGLS